MYLELVCSIIFIFIVVFKIKLPLIPFDNINKIQSINKNKIQLSLFLIPLPLIISNHNFFLNFIILISCIIGFLDDKYGLSVKVRFLTISLAISIYTIFNNHYINFDYLFLENIYLLSILSVIFILGFIHTINMVDGKNGFALLIFLNIFVYHMFKSNFLSNPNLFDLIFFCILLTMLIINLANISYLGNAGVILLTMYFSYFLIDKYNSGYISEKEIYCLLSLPFLDGLRVTIARIYRDSNPFKADKNHLHHLINNWNLGIFYIIISLFVMSITAFKVNLSFHFIALISLINYLFLYFIFKKN